MIASTETHHTHPSEKTITKQKKHKASNLKLYVKQRGLTPKIMRSVKKKNVKTNTACKASNLKLKTRKNNKWTHAPPQSLRDWGIGVRPPNPQSRSLQPPKFGGLGMFQSPVVSRYLGPQPPKVGGLGDWGLAPSPPKLGPPTPQSWGVGGFQSHVFSRYLGKLWPSQSTPVFAGIPLIRLVLIRIPQPCWT